MKELKFIYETFVKKQVEEKEIEVKEDNGQKIEITRTVKKIKPIKVAIMKPNRRLYELAEIYYAKQMSNFIRTGLLPYSLVAKRYANDGGPLSEPEKDNLIKLKAQSTQLESEYFAIQGGSEEDINNRNQLLVKINNINSEVGVIQNAYADIFENTAEMKARNRTIEWWVLHLAYVDEDGKGYAPVFGEGDHEAKQEKYDEIDEKNDDFVNECIRKLSYLTSFWFAASNNLSKIDFDSMDRLYDKDLAKYRPVEDAVPSVKIADKTPIAL